MTTDRRLRYGEAPTHSIIAIWAGVFLLLLAFRAKNLFNRQFADPDDAMRLVQVRDLLNGQGWFDLHQYRLASPDGVLMHWSRLVDAPLFLVIGALRPLFGQWWAEQFALIVIPAALFLATVLVVGRMSWRLLGREASIFAVLSMAMLPTVLMQFLPMRIDHHGYQVLAFVFAVYALSWRNENRGAALAGVAMGLGTLISLELLPFAAILAIVLFSRWLRDHKRRWNLVTYMQALAASMIAGYLLFRGVGDLANYCDVISPGHLGFFIAAALGTGLVASVPRLPPAGIAVALGAVGALGAGFFAWSAPVCIGSPFGSLDPVVEKYWYSFVLEGQPLWKHSALYVLTVAPQLLIALGASIVLALRNGAWLRGWWMEYSIILFLGAIAAVFTARSLSIIACVGAVPIGWLAVEMIHRWRETRRPVGKIMGALGIAVVLVPATLTVPLPYVLPKDDKVEFALAQSTCYDTANYEKLAGLETGYMVAPIDLAANVLEKTGHSVLASGHHRANPAMADLIRLNIGTPEEARAILAKRHADYLLFCNSITEARLYEGANKDTFAAQLSQGHNPQWLVPVNIGLPADTQLYRVQLGSGHRVGEAIKRPGNPSPHH